MEEAAAERAVVTPFAALFYDEGWEALAGWRAAFTGDPRFRLWAVLNPAYQDWEPDLEAAAGSPEVAGLRLFPPLPRVPLNDPRLAVLDQAASCGMPVNLTARLLDDRLHPRPPAGRSTAGPPGGERAAEAVPERPLGPSAFYASELNGLYPALVSHPQAYVDIGCVKPLKCWWEEVVRRLSPERLLGTGAPLYYYGGTRLSFERAALPEDVKSKVLRENALRLFWPADEERASRCGSSTRTSTSGTSSSTGPTFGGSWTETGRCGG